MTTLRKFARLSLSEQALLANAVLLLVAVRAALWLLPWRRAVVMFGPSRISSSPQFSVDRVEWAVRNASRFVPRATCLTRALALHRLLSRTGHSSTMQIGVAKAPGERFVAHAWVEHDGDTLLGSEDEIAHYSRLLKFETPF